MKKFCGTDGHWNNLGCDRPMFYSFQQKITELE